MTQEQIMSLVRDVLRIGGTIAGVFGVAAGTIETWSSLVLTIGGPIIVLAGVIWGQFAHSRTAIVASASAMPEVKAMTISDPALVTAAREAGPGTAITRA